MFTVDLEQKLIKTKEKEIRSNKSVLEQAQSLLDSANEEDLKLLESCGFESTHLESIISANDRTKFKLDASRVFKRIEIQQLCLDYNLRFLNVEYYKGTRPPELPQKIREFQTIYTQSTKDISNPIHTILDKTKIFIAAPKESFKLEERPKDPLLFYSLGNDMYYLVHKWGNDLSIINRIRGNFNSHDLFNYVNLGIIAICILLSYGVESYNPDINSINLSIILFFVLITAISGIRLGMGFYSQSYINNWDSKYID